MSEQNDGDSSSTQQRSNWFTEETTNTELEIPQCSNSRSRSSRRNAGKLYKHKKCDKEKRQTNGSLKGKRLKTRKRTKRRSVTDDDDDSDEECLPNIKKGRTVRKEHRCSHCNKQFTKHHVLLRHVYTHTGERPHMCKLCGKGFTEVRHLRHHKGVVHEGLRPYMCDVCGKTFTATQHLRQHKRAVHDKLKPHQCEYCHNWFSESSNLLRHRRTVHEGWKPYQCEECGKGFTANQTLKWHKRCVHEGERPFQCEFCGKGFSTPRDLKHHRYLHTGEKPHECDVCGKRFTQPGNLKIHKRGVHHGQWMKAEEDGSRSQEDDPEPVGFTEPRYPLANSISNEDAMSSELVSAECGFIMQQKEVQGPGVLESSDSQQVEALQNYQLKGHRQNVAISDEVNVTSLDEYACRSFDEVNSYNVISQLGLEYLEQEKKEVVTYIGGKSVNQQNCISHLGMELSEQQKKEILAYVEGRNINEQCFISKSGIELPEQQKREVPNSLEEILNQESVITQLGVELSEQQKREILSFVEEKSVDRKSDVIDPSLRKSNGAVTNDCFNVFFDPKVNNIELAADYRNLRTISECLRSSSGYKFASDAYLYYSEASNSKGERVNEVPIAVLDVGDYPKEFLEATSHQQRYTVESQLSNFSETSLRRCESDNLDGMNEFKYSTSELYRQALAVGEAQGKDLEVSP